METNSTSATCTVNGDCGTGVVIAPTVRDPNASVGSGGADVGYTGPTIAEIIDALAGVIEFSHLAQSLRTRIDIINSLEAGFNELSTQVVTDNSVMAQQLIGLRADLTDAVAYVNNQTTIELNERQALVTSINQMVASLGDGISAALQEESIVRAEQTGALFAEKTVKTDLAGNVAGYGLSSYADPSGAVSEFRVAADRFSIAPPAYVSATPPPAEQMHDGKVWVDTSQGSEAAVTKWWSSATASWSLTPVTSAQPFIYLTTPTTLPDGTVVDPGLYVNSANITKLRADQIDTRGLTIKDAEGNIIFGSGIGLNWDEINGTNKPEDGATRNVFRGNWGTAITYTYGDIVLDGGNGWRARSTHTSSGTNKPPASGTGNTWWDAYTIKGDTGSNGLDGLTIVAPNSSHTLPASSAGAVSSYTGSGTTIEVFDGSTAVNAVASINGNNQFTVGTPVVTGTSTISPGARTYSGTVATVAQHGTMSAAGTISIITYPITVRRSNGTNVSLSFQQTLSKSLAGANGTNGAAGQGQVKAVAFLRSLTTPATPSVSGSFASPTPTGWSDGIPAGTAPLWQTTRIFTSDGASPQQAAWTTPSMVANTSSVKYQFSTDNVSWSDTASTNSNYIRTGTSTDGGNTWTFSAGVLVKGEQGPKGDTGTQGIPGSPGADGATLYTWIKYASTPTSGISDFPEGKAYIGVAYNKTTSVESTNYADYTWSLIKGEQGVQGPQGIQGQTTYTWIKYADTSDGTGLSDSPTGKKYIGIAPNKLSNVESTTPGDYTWALIQGPQGVQGIQGAKGEDGVTLYTWVKYADTPTTGMSDFPGGKKYLGIAYNKTTADESLVYGDYTWSLIQGDQGVQGPTGPQGQTTYTWIKYADDSSGTGMSDSSAGKKYIGIAPNKLSATESSSPGDYTWSLIQGPQGDEGPPGPAVVVLTDRTPAFTSTDGVLDSGQSNIVFTASVFGIDSPTYQWSVTGAQTAPTALTGSTLTLTAAQFGVATSVIVKCTVNGLYSDQEPVHRLNKSTAAAGATVGATLGHAVVNSTLFSTDFANVTGWSALSPYAAERTLVSDSSAVNNNAVRLGNNSGNDTVWFTRSDNIAFDSGKLYRVRARVKREAGDGLLYVGFEAINASGQTIDKYGVVAANRIAAMHFVAATDALPNIGQWVEYVGYVKGHASSGAGDYSPDQFSPAKMFTGTVNIRPVVVVNWPDKTGQVLLDYVIVEDVTAVPANTQGKITPVNASTWIADAAIGNAQIANAAIGNAQIGDLQVGTLKIQDNAVMVPVAAVTNNSGAMAFGYVYMDTPGKILVTVTANWVAENSSASSGYLRACCGSEKGPLVQVSMQAGYSAAATAIGLFSVEAGDHFCYLEVSNTGQRVTATTSMVAMGVKK